jgi:hypothetical protein
MTQEDKELLLRDLCARLQYGVKISVNDKIESLQGINVLDNVAEYGSFLANDIEEIKPYLFPLSSMTKEQESYLHFNTKFRTDMFGDLVIKIDEDDNYFYTDIFDYVSIIDWLNKNHFDYRGLIEKGLAIDATNLNIY